MNIATKKTAVAEKKLIYPKEYKANRDYRINVFRRIEDPEFKKLLKDKCKNNVKFFFNTFLYTFDPRVSPYTLPFITYRYEDELIDWIVTRLEGRDGLIDKSRDMGVTWTILGVMYHGWLFGKGFQGHVGSKTENDVDRSGDMKSLFEKLRFFVKTTPSWLLPKFESRFMRLINEDNGNSITGESANAYFARAGRYKMCFYDEFAVTEYANDIWTAMGDSSPCRLVCGTPYGTGNKFWSLRHKELAKQDVLSIHWTRHPKKAAGLYIDEEGKKKYSYKGKHRSPWYDNECERRSAQEVGQELDIDYLASGNPYFDLRAVNKQEEWVITDGTAGNGFYEIGILARVDNKMEFRPGKNGIIRIYEYPSPLTQATIGGDPAEGLDHGDYTAIAVRGKKNGNLLAAVYAKIPPDEAAILIKQLSFYYNNALCAAEMGGYGLVINQYLWEEGCNVFRDVDTRKGGEKEGSKLGFNTKRHRSEMLKLAEEELRNEAVETRDRDLKVELLSFINKNGKPQASTGACDDFIIAWSMAGLMSKWYPYSKKIESSVIGRQVSIYGSEREAKPNMGFGFLKSGNIAKRRF